MKPCEPPENRPSVNKATSDPEPGAHDGRRGRQHFRHARSPLGTFVANDDHVPLVDLILLERRQHLFFGIEHVGRAPETRDLLCP